MWIKLGLVWASTTASGAGRGGGGGGAGRGGVGGAGGAAGAGGGGGGVYTVRDLATTILGYGARHFDPERKAPHIYCQALLMCQEYERALGYDDARRACFTLD